jgi:hypothetical protein
MGGAAPGAQTSSREDAAKDAMADLATSVLAVSLCKNAQFKNEKTVASDVWCAATIKAAKERHSENLTGVE